jgi:uncharacterized protein YbbC (DUF1343 family)
VLTKLIALAIAAILSSSPAMADSLPAPVLAGAEVLAASGFAAVSGKRVGLIANQTSLAHGEHLADLLASAPGVKLVAIFAPEHGLRGAAEAGAEVRDGIDAKTGIPVYSLYGSTKTPTPAMLRGIDVLVFDVQDIGARSYTYISTMGLAMQAAARAGIPLIVLDRPNPLGGDYVSGFVLEPALRSFVGQYPIPIVHGLTVGELARMIKGERWLEGAERVDLRIVEMQGWRRSMRWPQIGRTWVPTSPNIPTFEAALVYPGIGLVGETDLNEGRGTPTPFSVFGAPWLASDRLLARLNRIGLPGVAFEPAAYTPTSIPGVASRPRFAGARVNGVRVAVSDASRVEPLEIGMHVLAALAVEARAAGRRRLIANLAMFHAVAGTKRLNRMLMDGRSGAEIIAAWRTEVARFRQQRAPYLLYPN